MHRIARLLLGVTALALSGCAVEQTSFEFRSPPGSSLTFQNAAGADVGRVGFPGQITLARTDSPGGEASLTLTGSIRVDQLIEEAALPSQARGSLVETRDGVEVKVQGLYQVFSYDPTRLDLLDKHFVDFDRPTLERLLTGKPVEYTLQSPSKQPVLKLVLSLQ